MKAIYFFTSLALAMAMVGCQGQNPFKRQNDPIQDYRSSLSDAKPYDPNAKNVTPPEPDNSQKYCAAPVLITVENDHGEKLLTFTEDTESSYVINVRSLVGKGDFSVQTSGLPTGATFSLNSRKGNVAAYKLTWKPSKIESEKEALAVATLHYVNAYAQQICGQDISKRINLLVERNNGQPVITISGVPATKIVYGNSGSFKFQVQVDDPASTATQGPQLADAEFKESLSNAEAPTLNGASAAACPRTGKNVPGSTKWTFDCKFTSTALTEVKDQLNSGKSFDYAFFFRTVSQRSGASTSSGAVRVNVEFQKVETNQPAVATSNPRKGGI